MKFFKPNPAVAFIIFFAIMILIFFHQFLFSKQVLVPAHLLRVCYPWRMGEIQKGNNWVGVDAIFTIYPFEVYTNHSIQQKTIPKWNPYNFCGAPFFANSTTAVFSPFNVLNFFLKPEYCFTVKIILNIFLCCLFMGAMVWKLTKNIFSALLSGLIYGFNGIFIQFFYTIPHHGFMLWLPVLFLFLVCDVGRHNYFYGIAAGLIIAVQILSGAGSGTLLIYTIIAVLVFGIYFSIIQKRQGKSLVFFKSPLFTAIFSIGLGLLLSAVQVLPLIESVSYSNRRIIDSTLTTVYTLPATLINLLSPYFWGGANQTSRWGHYLYYYLFNTAPNPILFSAYVGILPIFLFLLVAGKRGSNRYCVFFSWLAIASFFFSSLHPLFVPILRFIPLLNKIHNHQRALYLFAFSLSVVSGISLAALIQGDISLIRFNRIKKALVVILLLIVFLTAVINITLFISGEKLEAIGKAHVKEYYGNNYLHTKPLGHYYRLVDDVITKVKKNFSFKNTFFWRSLACFSIALGIFAYAIKKEKNRIKLAWVCVVFVLADLFSYDFNLITYVEPQVVYPPTPAIKLLQKKSQENYSRVIGLLQQKTPDYGWTPNINALEVLPSSSSLVFKLYDARGYSNIFPKKYYEFFRALYKANYIADVTAIMFPDFNQRVFDLLSARYILTAPGFKLSQDSLELIYDNEITIYENKNALPRVFLAPEIKNVENNEETFKILGSPDFNPHHLVLVMGYDRTPFFKAQLILDSDASIIDFQPNKVVIEARMKSKGPLILTDTYFPGWKAFIDGKQTQIYRANYIHRMVVVPEGVHLIEFIYDPLSFKIGALISIGVFAGCCIFVCFTIKYNFRKGSNYV